MTHHHHPPHSLTPDEWREVQDLAMTAARLAAVYREALVSWGFKREEAVALIAAHGHPLSTLWLAASGGGEP